MINGSIRANSTVTINHITLSGLKVNAGTIGDNMALMIYNMQSGVTVDLEQIVIPEGAYSDTDTNIASALIANIGDDNSVGIKVNFNKIILSSNSSKLFKNALFVNYYRYSLNAVSMVAYNFTFEDYNNKEYTKGHELTDGVYYYHMEGYHDEDYYVGSLPEGRTMADTFEVIDFTTDADSQNLKPYIRKNFYILVNFKSANITMGCGTYRDPYIIDQPGQLLSLFYLLKLETQANLANEATNPSETLKGWKVNQTGDDSTQLVDPPVLVDYWELDLTKMASAYYQITQNIDLSSIKYNDFVGLGTMNLPFTGVMIGKEVEGHLPVISMPIMNITTNFTSVSDFGVIMYAKGAVVKDLEVYYGNPPNAAEKPTKVNITSNAGTIAKIIGGDNMIDNVKITGSIVVNNGSARVGGYVGRIINGNVIFRNIQSGYFSDYHIFSTSKTEISNLLTQSPSYPYACSMIGSVEEGFSFLESDGTEIENVPIVRFKDSFTANTNLAECRTFQILNSNYFNQPAVGKINVKNLTGNPIIEIANASQLEILQLAVNSGALYYKDAVQPIEVPYGSGNPYIVSYDSKARTRYSDYSSIGNVPDSNVSTDAAYQAAIKENIKYGDTDYNFEPYLQKYFKDEADESNKDNIIYNEISKGSNFAGKRLSIHLTNTGEYDLGQFQNSFRGIVSRYKGSFLGTTSETECSIIKMYMISDRAIGYGDNDYKSIGLFRDISNSTSTVNEYKDFKITGTIVNTYSYAVWEDGIPKAGISDSSKERNAGGIAGNMAGFFLVSNVSVEGLNIQADRYVGGLFGKCRATTASTIDKASIKNTNTETVTYLLKGIRETGGFIGSYENGSTPLTMKDCYVIDTEITSSIGAGGMIGKSAGNVTIQDTRTEEGIHTIENLKLTATGSDNSTFLGGLIGNTSEKGDAKYSFDGISISNSEMSDAYRIGGIVGYTNSEVEILNVNVDNCTFRNNKRNTGGDYCGALIGKGESVGLVLGTTTTTKNKITNNLLLGNTYVGGVAGYMALKYTDTPGRISNTDFLQNKMIVDSNHYQDRRIGGLCGQYILSNSVYSIDSLSFQDNIIAQSCGINDAGNRQNCRIGGVIGELTNYDINNKEVKANHITMVNNCIGYINPEDLLDISTINQGKCKMYNSTSDLAEDNRIFYSTSATNIPEGALTQEDEINYAHYTGLAIGFYNSSGKCYIYDFKRNYDPDNNYARPVVDVGYPGTATSYEQLFNYQELCHIYYGVNHEVNAKLNDTIFQDPKISTLKSIMDYYTTDAKDEREKYDTTQLESLLTQKIYDITYYGNNDGVQEIASYQSPFVEGTGDQEKILPVIHYDAKCGDLNTVICNYLAAVTNRTMDSEIASAIATQAQLTYSGGTYSMTVDDTSSEKTSVIIKDGKFVYNCGDSYNEATKNGTITLIKFSLGYDYATTKTMTGGNLYSEDSKAEYDIIIPIFVEDILEINSYLRFMEGAQLDVTQMIKNGAEKATINNNSTYTIYAEFTYHGNFLKYQDMWLDRSLYCIANGVNTSFYKGTKLTLIDVLNHQVYYKVITEDQETSIPLTEFKSTLQSEEASSFAFTKFNQIKTCGNQPTILKEDYPELDVANMGVEQFLFIIDTSNAQKVTDEGTSNIIYEVHLDKQTLVTPEDYQLDHRLIQNKLGTVSITEYPGFSINFGDMSVEGSITKESVISMKSTIDIDAIQAFWQQYAKSENESYIDLQVSLVEVLTDDTTQQVNFPEGTQIFYLLNPQEGESPNLYKPGKINYYLSKEGMSKSLHTIAVNNTSYVKQSLSQELTLDFSDADLSGYNGNYQVVLTLVRSDLKDSPESGNKLQEFKFSVTAKSVPDLAFAVDTMDSNQLGVNVYQGDVEHKIDFTTSFGFDGFTTVSELEETKDYEYVVMMQLFEKTKAGYSQIDDMDGAIRIANIEKDESGNVTQFNDLVYDSSKQCYTMTMNDITQVDIQSGNSITREFQLIIQTATLERSNYKVLVQVEVRDKITKEKIMFLNELKDYLIFCVSNIKTD